jgi:hypothetical protein
MRPILTAIAAALLWNAVASAGFEISDLLFRPNFNADRDLMQHAQAAQREPAYQLQEGNAKFSKDYNSCASHVIVVCRLVDSKWTGFVQS